MKHKQLSLLSAMIFYMSSLFAQDITLVDRISGTNNTQNLTTILDWSSVADASFKLSATNRVTLRVNTKQTIGNFTYQTALNPVMPTGATAASVTESQYSTAPLTDFGSRSWNPILPATSTPAYNYAMKLTTTVPGKCQFTMGDFDYNEHYQVYGTLNNGTPVVPQYVLRAASNSNITATPVAGSYLDLKSNNGGSTSDYDIKGSVDVFFNTNVDKIVFIILKDQGVTAIGSIEITNVMGVVPPPKETRLTLSSNSGTQAQKDLFAKITTKQMDVSGSDYDGTDYANVTTFDNLHYAESNVRKTLIGTNIMNCFSLDTHIQGNADIYVNVLPDADYNLLPQCTNPWGHDYPFFPNKIQFNMGLEVSIDYDARNYVIEKYQIGNKIGAYGVWIRDEGHDASPEIHTVDQLWTKYTGTGNTALYRLGHLSDGSNRFDSISYPGQYTSGFWAEKPSKSVYAVAFKVLLNGTPDTYTITNALSKKMNPLTNDPTINKLFVNDILVLTVTETGGNFADIGFSNVYRDANGYVKGFITITTSVNQKTNVGDAYLFMDVNKNGFVPGTPAIPANMSVSQVTGRTAKFSWSGADGSTVYQVQTRPVGTSNWGYTEIRQTTGNSKYGMGFGNSTTQEWRLLALKNGGIYISPTVGQFTTTNAVPASPTGLNVTNITSTSMQLNWTPVAGAVGYDIEYGRSFDPWIQANRNGIITSNSYVLSGLLPASAYTWRVAARFADSSYSDFARDGYHTTGGVPALQNDGANHKGLQNDTYQPMDPENVPGYKNAITLINPEKAELIAEGNRLMHIYPNPVEDEMEIMLNNTVAFSSVTFSVYSVDGKNVGNKKYNSMLRDYEMDCGKLKPGRYYIKALLDNNKIMLATFIKAE